MMPWWGWALVVWAVLICVAIAICKLGKRRTRRHYAGFRPRTTPDGHVVYSAPPVMHDTVFVDSAAWSGGDSGGSDCGGDGGASCGD